MKQYIFVLLFILSLQHLSAQQQIKTPAYFQFASQQNRTKLYKKYVDTTIRLALSEPLADSTEGEWNEAFWAMELLVYKNDFSNQKLTEAWQQANNLSEYFQKNLIEVSYALYPVEFKKYASSLLSVTGSASVFVRCAEYLLRADPGSSASIQNLIQTKYKDSDYPGLSILQNRLASINKVNSLPPLKDIFSKNFLKNQTIIYSLQRKNRDYAGLVIIRQPNGKFVRNNDGSIFHVSQLARAVTNYPFYITNGNTPQGIFRWSGFEISKLSFIGPTPNLQLTLPIEAKPSVFFGDSSLVNEGWQKNMYASMLPSSWKNYEGIYESFFAGIMGRNEIIMHGTTVDPAYYKGQLYYPQTPSLGCLCSYEEWNNKGELVKSNQQQIVDALDEIDSSNGYVVVIELNNEKKAVNIADVQKFLQ